MSLSQDRTKLLSAFRVVDDTLEELGLPGPFELLPTPSEVFSTLGIPTPDSVAERFKARLQDTIRVL